MKFQNPRYINKMGDKEYMKYLPNGEDKSARYGTPRIKTPKEMIDYVHKQNAHIMISVWASFGPWTEMYQKMDSLKALGPTMPESGHTTLIILLHVISIGQR
jgi:alpha-D-xyloside xylohydrolase